MRQLDTVLFGSIILLGFALPASATPRAHRGPTSPKLQNKRSSKPTPKPQSQHAIDSQRATQLQTALIKAGYLSGTASGTWDGQTEAAMQKLQADNGWQTKIVPDSRAIIKLGLGPNATATTSRTGTAPLAPETLTH